MVQFLAGMDSPQVGIIPHLMFTHLDTFLYSILAIPGFAMFISSSQNVFLH